MRIGFGRLIDGTFDLATGSIERSRAKADFRAKMREQVVSSIAEVGQTELARANPKLSASVAEVFLNEFEAKFVNRGAIAEAAFEDLQKNPPPDDPAPEVQLDRDWLNRFVEAASLKSEPEMQVLMGKILAGEIRQPGTYSQLSIHILTTLSQRVAKNFEKLCSISFELDDGQYIPIDLFPTFTTTGVPIIGLTYVDLMELRAYQLLAVDTGTGYDVKINESFLLRSRGKSYLVQAKVPNTNNLAVPSRRVAMAPLTPMGAELSKLISSESPIWIDAQLMNAFVEPNWSFLKL